MFCKHHRKYIKQFSLPGMSNPMILGLLSITTPSKLISSAKPLWEVLKGKLHKERKGGGMGKSASPLNSLSLFSSPSSFTPP